MPRKAKHHDNLSDEYKRGYRDALAKAKEVANAAAPDMADFSLDELWHVLDTYQGYFRVGRGLDGLAWVRFKFTGGIHEGSYVFGSGESLGMAISQACVAAHDVQSGKRKAHKDTGYRNRKDHPKGG